MKSNELTAVQLHFVLGGVAVGAWPDTYVDGSNHSTPGSRAPGVSLNRKSITSAGVGSSQRGLQPLDIRVFPLVPLPEFHL